MPISADHIRETITDYIGRHPDEKERFAPVLGLLDAGADVTSRKEFRGHATAGAILTRPDGRVLHVRHLALDRWLLPGGHLEADDARLVNAALRELTEETGIPESAVQSVSACPLHIDMHTIPANDDKGEPEHQHIDFRFHFRTSSSDAVNLQTEEVTAAAWREPDALTDETLRSRVAQMSC